MRADLLDPVDFSLNLEHAWSSLPVKCAFKECAAVAPRPAEGLTMDAALMQGWNTISGPHTALLVCPEHGDAVRRLIIHDDWD